MGNGEHCPPFNSILTAAILFDEKFRILHDGKGLIAGRVSVSISSLGVDTGDIRCTFAVFNNLPRNPNRSFIFPLALQHAKMRHTPANETEVIPKAKIILFPFLLIFLDLVLLADCIEG